MEDLTYTWIINMSPGPTMEEFYIVLEPLCYLDSWEHELSSNVRSFLAVGVLPIIRNLVATS
jgi:hypothetical protein